MATQDQIRDQITKQIIEALEKGDTVPPWRQGWLGTENGGRPTNVISKKPYRGINPLLLSLHRLKYSLRSRWYGTYRQWQDMGGQVMRRPNDCPPGDWGCGIIFWSKMTKTEENEHGEEKEKDIFFLRTYSVFCIDQVEGDHLDYLRAKDDGPTNDSFVDYDPAERAIAATEATIKYHGDRAYYRRDTDEIVMPPKTKFPQEVDFYATAFHELGHWSEKRTQWSGDYAECELRAEIAASYIMAEINVPQSSDLSNHSAYLKSWLQALKNDNRYIFKASSAASKAADFILSFSRQPVPDLEEVPS